jgi:hypothetical protein
MAQFDNVKFELLGESEGVRDWQGLQIIATFDNDNNQPNITTSELTFSLDMGKKIIDHIDNGAGVFQGIDFEMFLNNPSTEVFKGILDLADDIEVNREKKEVKAKLLKLDGLNTFANISEGITMGLLESEGKFTSTDYVDIPYIKETEFDYFGTAILIVSIFQIQQQLSQIIKDGFDLGADTGGEAAGGALGPIGAAIIAFGKAAAQVIYYAAMFFTLISMVQELINTLFPIPKKHRGIKLKRILEVGCEFAGYEFVASSMIPELDELYILPRKTQEGRIIIPKNESGLPVTGGPLYTLGKCVGLVKDLFNAKVKIVDNKVYIEPLKNKGFWELGSDYEMPPIKVDIDKYNTNELIGTKVISFSIDNNNYWDLDNYRGTSYEIKTIPKSLNGEDYRSVLIKGLSELTFPVALGTRKKEGSILERTFKTFANIADSLSSIFKTNNNFFGTVQAESRDRLLRMSTDLVNIPKLLRLTPELKMKANNRDIWSAKYLYDRYHYVNSFVKEVANKDDQDNLNQYKVYQKIKMNASFEDFLKIINNNIATDEDGNRVVFDSILYNFGGGYWEADYRIQYQYSTNLKESYTEPT